MLKWLATIWVGVIWMLIASCFFSFRRITGDDEPKDLAAGLKRKQ